MSTDIRITIAAEDRFSPAFEALSAALSKASNAGEQTRDDLAGVGDGLARMAEQAQGAGEAAATFGEQVGAGVASALEAERAALEEGQAMREQAGEKFDSTLEAQSASLEAHYSRDLAIVAARSSAILAVHREFWERVVIGTRKAVADEDKEQRKRLNAFEEFYESLYALDRAQGSRQFRFFQSVAIVEATVATYQAVSKAFGSAAPPLSYVLAAAALARGLANVAIIRQQKPPAAHGGLEFVPAEQTYLLERGERVLSPRQNRELTDFLRDDRRGGGAGERWAGLAVQNLTIHVLENATAGEALLRMDPATLRQVVAERLIPALDELARLGIRPRFTEANV